MRIRFDAPPSNNARKAQTARRVSHKKPDGQKLRY